jgi:hypothetical protein
MTNPNRNGWGRFNGIAEKLNLGNFLFVKIDEGNLNVPLEPRLALERSGKVSRRTRSGYYVLAGSKTTRSLEFQEQPKVVIMNAALPGLTKKTET